MNILYYVCKRPYTTFLAAQTAQTILLNKHNRRFPIETYIDGQPIEAC